MRFFYFLFLLLLSSCTSGPKKVTHDECARLPTPPFSELKNRSLSDSEAIYIRTSSIKETVSSLQKVLSAPHLQRAHLEELCFQLFQKLAESDDLDTTIMTLLATSSTHHPLSRSITKHLLHSPSPLIQLVAVQSLFQTNDADSLLVEALRSNFIAVRFEAAWQLAKKRSRNSFFHIDALYSKLPEEFHPHMAELFAQEGSSGSIHRLRQMLYDAKDEVVVSSLLAIGKYSISELSNETLSLTAHSPHILEALAYALHCNEGSLARDRLLALSAHHNPHVQLQALLSRIAQGELPLIDIVAKKAEQGDLYALSALRSLPSLPQISQPPLSKVYTTNYALALLEHKDPAVVPYLQELLALSEDEILLPAFSPANTHQYWDLSTLYSFPEPSRPMLYEHSLVTIENLLAQTVELDESAFLDVAQFVFQQGRIELYPMVLSLLKNKRSDGAISLLQQEASRVGAPYNRVAASLGLIQLNVLPEESLKEVLEFTREKKDQPWRHPLPHVFSTQYIEKRHQNTTSAQLYVEALETLAQSGSESSISLLQKELELVPTHFLPFVVGALLHATL